MRATLIAASAFILIGVAISCGGSNSDSSINGAGGTTPGSTSVGNTSTTGASTPATTTGGPATTGAGNPTTTAGSSGSGGAGALVTYGDPYTGGQYNLGPVDYTETQFHNACAPGTKYSPTVQAAEGMLLAGLWDGIPNTAGYCDACIWVTTAKGKSAMLRVVTYGDTTSNSIDTSPSAYQILNSGEYPRAMTWQFAKCPETGPMMYEFQTGSNAYWTSLWVRNARVPVTTVEVQSANHTTWTALDRGSDGTLTDGSGFGQGMFSIRSTGMDGTQVVDTFPWPSAGIAGAFLTGKGNFD